MSGKTQLSRLPSLTGMRFIAALLVFLFHTSLTSAPALSPFHGELAESYQRVLDKAGWVGVSFFFILSGFVLAYSARPGDSLGAFLRRRLVKLYPNHLVTFAASMILFAAAASTWRQWLPNLFLVHTWIPRTDSFFSVNPPSWSLTCEVFFYLCFPLLFRWIKKIDPACLWAWAGAVTAAIVLVPAVAYLWLPDGVMPNGYPVSEWQYWVVYMLPPVRTLEFVLGILMARIVLAERWIGVRVLPVTLLLIACYVVALNVPWLFSLNAATVVPLALLIPAVAADDLRGRPSLFRGRVMVRLGEVSFAFYLVHAVVITEVLELVVRGRELSALQGVGVIVLELSVSLALAWLLNIWVEEPAMKRWSRPRRDRMRPRPAAVTAAVGQEPAVVREPAADREPAASGQTS
ncbi:acyltransferase family protein [Streptomyces sp. NPDC059009]|uniref:acyltransferase family protein n=1 Tax=Streptomyces sp. NPDC059009 TaxID=3346694 RepID=UPI00368884DD